jgi:hypothetical protein
MSTISTTSNNQRTLIIFAIIVVAAMSRILPNYFHLDYLANFSPIMAIALFGGAKIADRRLAFAIPIGAMLLSDIFIGFHATMWAVYIAFALGVLIGMKISGRENITKVGLAAVSSSIVFFALTNLAYWFMYYDVHTIETLGKCYFDAIVFYRTSGDFIPLFLNTVLGDLFFSAVLFGGFALAEKRIAILAKN